MADFSSTFHFLLTFLLLLRPSLSSAPNLSELFEIWCAEHGKTYSSAEEKLYRFGVFADNYDFVSHHNNLGDSSYALSLNAFADLTHHEFKASRLGFSLSAALRNSQPVPPQEPSPPLDVPDSLDWRKEGAVTAVKDQGSCGIFICYVFFFFLEIIMNSIEQLCLFCCGCSGKKKKKETLGSILMITMHYMTWESLKRGKLALEYCGCSFKSIPRSHL